MKKVLAFALAIMMALGCTSAFAEADYSEHMDFIASYIDYGVPAAEDDMYHYFLDQFNMDVEMIGLSQANWNEQVTIAINGGSMQDWCQWDYSYSSYKSYAEQGLIRALPDGWEEKYPNIYHMVVASGLYDVLNLDGKVYCIPHGININMVEGTLMGHNTMYYRADWAEQVGIEIGDSCTLTDFMAYIKAVEDAGLTNAGINGTDGNIYNIFMNQTSEKYNSFLKTDAGYIWGPQGEGVVEGIKLTKEAYENGIINADYYLLDNISCRDQFTSGLAATYLGDGTISNYELLNQNAEAAGITNYLDAINCTVITNDEGNFVGDETTNYWTALILNPELTDEQVDRILAMTDFCCSLEGEMAINMGMPEKDWTIAEDGSYVNLRTPNEDGSYTEIKNVYNSLYFFWFQGILPDEFTFVNPGLNKTVQERITTMYNIRGNSPAYHAIDWDYQLFTSEAKDQYSVDVAAEITRIVTDPSIALEDVEDEWNNFIENYRAIWEPVVNDLNAAYFAD